MIYFALKKLMQLAFLFFFRKKIVDGVDNMPKNGPLIVAVNHPNTLIDPLLVGSEMKRRVGFLANASIFVNGLVNRIFKYFWVIPIYRKKDLKEGQVQDNRSSFKSCYEFFDKNGALLIFPEGTSVNELKLRDIKTGTARIALSYEAERNFKAGLKINTIALSYSDSLRFRSIVSMNVNPSFLVSEYRDVYLEDKEKSVRLLTQRISQELQGLLTITDNKEQERSVIEAQKFYTEYIDTRASRFADPKLSFSLRKEIAIRVRVLGASNPLVYDHLSTSIRRYFEKVNELGLTPGFFRDQFLNKGKTAMIMLYLIQLLVLFPLYIVGLITNYFPYRIPKWIFGKLKVEEEYRATVLVLGGIIFFPIYYFLMAYLFYLFINEHWYFIVLFILSLPFFGYAALFFHKIWVRFKRVIHFYFKIDLMEKTMLIEKRDKIIEGINRL